MERLCQVQHRGEHPHVDLVGGDVVPPARVDRDARVVQDAVFEIALLREQAVDEAREPDGAVVVAQGNHAIGHRGLARVRQCCRPRVHGAAEAGEPERERAKLTVRRRDAAVVAVGPKHGEGQRPIDVLPGGNAQEAPCEGRRQAAGRRRRIRQKTLQPDRGSDARLVGFGLAVDGRPQRHRLRLEYGWRSMERASVIAPLPRPFMRRRGVGCGELLPGPLRYLRLSGLRGTGRGLLRLRRRTSVHERLMCCLWGRRPSLLWRQQLPGRYL